LAQHNWAYTGPSGRQYVVGLYHGSESGHLMVYCNLNVIHIDFHVLQNWKYSFFIEEDLLELKILTSPEGFQYDFDINRQIDTPRNRERNVREKQEKRSLAVFLGLVGLLVVLLLGAWWYNDVHVGSGALAQVRTSSWTTPAKVFFEPNAPQVRYSFVIGGESYRSKAEKPRKPLLPLESGDEFLVRYDLQKPHIHIIDFEQPTDRQIERYAQRALERHLSLHPELDKTYVECLLQLAFEQRGVDGYADFFYQKATPAENPTHNRNTYGRLVRDIPFQEMIRARCR
jgi:hypothetical protein